MEMGIVIMVVMMLGMMLGMGGMRGSHPKEHADKAKQEITQVHESTGSRVLPKPED